MIRALHLVGSAVSSFFRDLSCLYADDCLRSTADPALYDVHIAYVTPDGKWRFPSELTPPAIEAAEPLALDRAIERLIAINPDVVIPQMFCLPGMTVYRGLFDLLDIRYVGNPPDVMALGADKAKARAVVAAAGVMVPPAEVLRRGDRMTLPLPVVVKPVHSDNSTGVARVAKSGELDVALAAAFAHDDDVLVETYIELGREVRCGIVERSGRLVALPLEEYAVDSATKPVRLPEDKLRRGEAGDLRLVAKDQDHAWIVDDDDPVNVRVHAAALAAYRALGCRHYGLFDFRIDPQGTPWFLEAGLYCSFASTSVICVMAEAAGISVRELFADAIARATG